ncbi:MAG TPA: nucleoside deaminase [Polyangiaceae bacterium]|nr:nucleoside deaminase [Polyangiaceae bacterium]
MKSDPPRAGLLGQITLDLPAWLQSQLAELPVALTSLDARVQLVLELARQNIRNSSGGPFAAAVFREADGALVSVGVNRVVPRACSSAHAEVMALSLAQAALGRFDLGAPELGAHQLVASWRPCAMCFGAIPWAGVRSVAIAGSGAEMEQLTGFDEGPIHPQWREELEKRGIRVFDNLASREALEVFREFASSGQLVYNGRGGLPPAADSGREQAAPLTDLGERE